MVRFLRRILSVKKVLAVGRPTEVPGESKYFLRYSSDFVATPIEQIVLPFSLKLQCPFSVWREIRPWCWGWRMPLFGLQGCYVTCLNVNYKTIAWVNEGRSWIIT